VAAGVDLRLCRRSGPASAPWDGATTGEIQVRAPWIVKAYYDNPRAADTLHRRRTVVSASRRTMATIDEREG